MVSLSPASLRARSLEHAQVIVLLGGAQLEQTRSGVVELERGALGRHGVREHGHDRVQVSRVAAAGHSGTRRVLQPLDLGSAERELVEELLRLGSGDSLGKICDLQDSTQHWKETGINKGKFNP